MRTNSFTLRHLPALVGPATPSSSQPSSQASRSIFSAHGFQMNRLVHSRSGLFQSRSTIRLKWPNLPRPPKRRVWPMRKQAYSTWSWSRSQLPVSGKS